jgi:phospholipase A1
MFFVRMLSVYALVFSSAAYTADTSTCYFEAIESASPETTVAELRAQCETPEATSSASTSTVDDEYAMKKKIVPREGASFSDQIAAEQQSLDRSYSLTPHKPNYLLAYSYSRNPNLEIGDSDERLDKQEAVLQISVKFPVWREILGTNNDLMFAYTGKSWFQAYNSALSKPFRETNYEPEVFLRHYGGPEFLGMRIAGWDFGYNHQSNGRSEPQSRSWDRLMGRMALDITSTLSLAMRAWYRLPESAAEDDNPDIHHYMGYGDLRAIWAPNKNTFTAMIRPGTQERGFELTWSYPINNHFRIYTHYYRGYGESLIDYNHKVERIGIGFSINDYIQAR